MTVKEHVKRLRRGVDTWNAWRIKHPENEIDLSDADLYRANLSRANLSDADLSDADLSGADLSGADLSGADLSFADLSEANLSGANLSDADLYRADLYRADLSGANLNGAHLSEAHLSEANLSFADLSNSNIGLTIFGNVNLSTVKGLETVHHPSPSTIGIDTIYQSQGQISDHFLRNAGVQDSFLEVMAALTNRPIEYYTCFISYSSQDETFVQRLYADLQSRGVRCWFAPEDLKIGDKIRVRIDESIRIYDKLLLILSQHAISSNWVEYEVEAALDKEQQKKRTVLFPIRLDNAVMESPTAWAQRMRTRNIGNFAHWKDHDAYLQAFDRLIRDLKADAAKDAT